MSRQRLIAYALGLALLVPGVARAHEGHVHKVLGVITSIQGPHVDVKKTDGKTDGDGLIAAMKGAKWESPRGPISSDPETRDIVQNIYIRKVEKVDGKLYNVEFATFDAVKDPVKAEKK